MKDIRISSDLRLTKPDSLGCVLRSDMQELEGSSGVGIERDEIMPLIAALYKVAELGIDPAERITQLEALLQAAREQLEAIHV